MWIRKKSWYYSPKNALDLVQVQTGERIIEKSQGSKAYLEFDWNLHNATNHSSLKVQDIQSFWLSFGRTTAERAAIFKPNLKPIISSRGNAEPNPKKCLFAYHFLVIDFYCFIRLINAVPHAASLYRGSPNALQLFFIHRTPSVSVFVLPLWISPNFPCFFILCELQYNHGFLPVVFTVEHETSTGTWLWQITFIITPDVFNNGADYGILESAGECGWRHTQRRMMWRRMTTRRTLLKGRSTYERLFADVNARTKKGNKMRWSDWIEWERFRI